ncbi:RNA polymerase III subunit RPC82-domain-containing protein [Zychaea mexicana]|uniref:RNA polymerase III subunit RPC82-domain-containing protein n=1 Tax=Zychaea mexicana TaxID=64656 RepID=UPI0022FE5A39|nr:RNA polymerase III subunit RPC82-domain-containing protein [Zychaea mexicana]KAI9491779.1 RNA polymerase III subunit RPC82-domain-containing protein [Zychaea mexicana]
MAAAGCITAVLPEHTRSSTDRYLAAEEKEAEKYMITTAKDLQAIKMAAHAQIEAESSMAEGIGMKRKAEDSLGPTNSKRAARKGDDDLDVEVDPKVFFGIHYEKFTMIFRNNAIVDYATERVNHTAGQVIKAFLDYGKAKMKSLHENDSPSASPLHIVNCIPSEIITQDDIVLQPDPLEPNKKPSLQEVVRAYIMLLKTDQAGFIKSKDEMGANQFSVNFAKLRETMKRRVFEGILREKYGVATCRIVRILIEKGKLDESQVQKLAMLPPKEAREKLGLLHTKGIVEIQAIPRSADRAPARTFFLWYVPLEKCYQEVLIDAYRVILNLQQRKREELKIRSRLLDKLSRQDVMENMDLLGDADKAELSQMQKVIQRLETSKKRMDDVVMIFRDF